LQVGVVQTQSQQHLKDIDIMTHNSSHSNEAVDAQELQDTAQTPERLANLGKSFDTSQLEQMSDYNYY
jgi:hypothetical protein